MVGKSQGVLDDELKQLNINDMSGGLVTAYGPLSLGPNQTPDSLNIFAYLGKLLFRGGFASFSTLPANADGNFTYVDTSGTQHLMAWSNGNLYDYRTGAPVLIAAAVYTAGQQIAHATLNGIMYWATLTVPLRQYDGTTEMAVPNSGGAGVVAPPACNWLLTYAGSLVAVYPVPSGVPEPSSFMWSDVNDPTTWFGTAIQTVGSNDGSICNFGLLMGIIPGAATTTGVPSTRQLMIGKSSGNIFLYQGALGTLQENAVPSPVGAQDGNSAVYIPNTDGTGSVMFLGNDGQFYLTNGSNCLPASLNIQNQVNKMMSDALVLNPNQRFYATYNAQFQYYMCDFGNNQQLVYKWDTKAWWLFSGWPSGPYTIARAPNGLPTIFVAGSLTPGVFQLSLSQTNDNGAPIVAYYTTPYLHGGKPEREKIFYTTTVFCNSVGIAYQVTATTAVRMDGTTQTTRPLNFHDPAFGAAAAPSGVGAVWDVSKWDQSQWGGGVPSQINAYPFAPMRGRLVVLSVGSDWVPPGIAFVCRSSAILLKIAWLAGIPDFQITGLNVSFAFRSTGFVGNLPSSTEGQQPPDAQGFPNRFTNTGSDT